MAATEQETRDAFQQVYDSLTDAYWAASTIVDKDRIRGMADAVYDILTELTRVDVQRRTAEYVALKTDVDTVTAKLQKLQDDIDSIIHNVKIAAEVTTAITKVIGVVATLPV